MAYSLVTTSHLHSTQRKPGLARGGAAATMGIPTVITLNGIEHIRYVMVCAWCPKESYRQLRAHEEYSHGICKTHLSQQRQIYREKQRVAA